MQSHAVSGMSTRKELANPFPRCKKQRRTKSLVSAGVSLRKVRGGVVWEEQQKRKGIKENDWMHSHRVSRFT